MVVEVALELGRAPELAGCSAMCGELQDDVVADPSAFDRVGSVSSLGNVPDVGRDLDDP